MDIEDEGQAAYVEPDDIEDEAQEVIVQEKDLKEIEQIQKKYAHLCRPPVDPSFSSKDSLIFMQTDVDYYMGKRLGQTSKSFPVSLC